MAQKKITNYAKIEEDHVRFLEKQGYHVVSTEPTDRDAVLLEILDSHGAVASPFVELNEEVFSRCPNLEVVGRSGVGYDSIDLEAATRHGVQIVNTPQPIIEPVAEHTISLILGAVRNLALEDRALREGVFRVPGVAPGPELLGKTLGIIGFGNTGQRLAEIGHLAFSMKILYYDVRQASTEVEARLGAERRDFKDVLAESDFVSVHCNLCDATRGLLDEEAFRSMKPTAYFFNCSRGPVVVEEALVRALKEGWISGAGVDVFIEEPPPADHPFFEIDNLVVSPHRAGRSIDSGPEVSRTVTEDVDRVLRGEKPYFPVNEL